jgi:hypothetical protein
MNPRSPRQHGLTLRRARCCGPAFFGKGLELGLRLSKAGGAGVGHGSVCGPQWGRGDPRWRHLYLTRLRNKPKALLHLMRFRWCVESWHWLRDIQLHGADHRYGGPPDVMALQEIGPYGAVHPGLLQGDGRSTDACG